MYKIASKMLSEDGYLKTAMWKYTSHEIDIVSNISYFKR